jgi:DHA1 family purine ribonucleoside efflux pump-like MFS transporter
VASLALGVCGLVTAEFLPIGLLTPIAADLAVSDGTAGQAMTATALVAAAAAPLVIIGARSMDRRLVLFGLTALLVLSNLLAAVATHVGVLLGARVLLGVALGGFWALAAALARRLVPPPLLPRALAIVFTGVSVATVCAAPLGALLGDLWGWRAVFLSASGIGVLALGVQVATMPPLPATSSRSLRSLADALRRPGIGLGLVTVLFVISGHFAGFTYVRPWLEQVPRLGVDMISLTLLGFGMAGFLGNLAGGAIAERSARLAIALPALLLVAATLALLVAGAATTLSMGALAAWGLAFGALPVAVQTWNVRMAGEDVESANALIVVAFQVAIAAGALIGGALVDRAGSSAAIAYCGAAVFFGGLLMLARGRRVEY